MPNPVLGGELSDGRRAVLAMYRRVRRYAVPRWMIEVATERRLAGDVAGACEAAGIELDVDLVAVAAACGQATAELVADDLRNLVPDLLCWHLPRVLDPAGAIWTASGVLRHYPAGGGANLLVEKDPVRLRLWVRTPRQGDQVLPAWGRRFYHLHRSYWDIRHVDELRQRCGGTDRIPFFHADGRRLDVNELPGGPRQDDPVATVEWLTMLQDRGHIGEALAACGITLTPGQGTWPQMAVERLVADARNVLEQHVPKRTVWLDGRNETQVFPDVELTFSRSGAVTARRRDAPIGESLILTPPDYRHPVDFDLLRFGYLEPDDLHPLVSRALFPARDAGSGPPPPSATGGTGSDVTRTPAPADGADWQLRSAPTAVELKGLRDEARRGRYRSMVHLAQGLYRTGLGQREVLAECFGVTFPDEFFALAEHVPLAGHRPAAFDHHAWKLAVPPDRGGPVAPRSGPLGDFDDDNHEQEVMKRDPDLIPLLRLDDHYTEYGGLLICYRLTELAAGRPMVFGIDSIDGVQPCGDSLLAVLGDYHAAIVGRLMVLGSAGLADHQAALDQVRRLIGPVDDPAPPRSDAAPLATLRERASRGDYRSMGRLARAFYATGRSPREVLAECFGVAFPDEFYALADADELPGEATNLPWELAVPLDRGGPVVRPWPDMWRAERRIFTWDPDLIPLVALYGDDRIDHGATTPQPRVPHGELIHCYRLSELAAGRTTVVAVPRHQADGDGDLTVESSGHSLYTILHEYLTAVHQLNEWEYRQPWNEGAGSIDYTGVEESREAVATFERQLWTEQ